MGKQLIYDEEARDALKRGINTLASAVKVTLGPKGRNVALGKKYGAPQVTHDGVTIAKEIEQGKNWSDEEKVDLVIYHQSLRPLFDMLGVCFTCWWDWRSWRSPWPGWTFPFRSGKTTSSLHRRVSSVSSSLQASRCS